MFLPFRPAHSLLMFRWVSKYVDPVMATGWHMVLGGIPLVVLSAISEADELGPRLALLNGDVPPWMHPAVPRARCARGCKSQTETRRGERCLK